MEVRTQSMIMREGSARAASKSALLDWRGHVSSRVAKRVERVRSRQDKSMTVDKTGGEYTCERGESCVQTNVTERVSE